MRKLAIAGATGSIGQNALVCVDNCPDCFDVKALSTHTKVEVLQHLAKKYRPDVIAVTGRLLSAAETEFFSQLNITVFNGQKAVTQMTKETDYDMFVNAIVGAAGFLPTLSALQRCKDIALANKETLVIGGNVVMDSVKKQKVRFLPIDSEHSAIFQSLMGEKYDNIERILLTASGGPFRYLPTEQFNKVTVDQALAHPNWSMGPKITIDSATMMNKGLEVIEAHWLFDMPADKIQVVIHPQSIIHSMVEFHDGSTKAQLGVPDMRVPIQLALTFPERKPSSFPRLDFDTLKELTFEQPNFDKFRCLDLAYHACKNKGTAPAVMNAANEIAVHQFIGGQTRFDQIAEIIEDAMMTYSHKSTPNVDDLLEADRWAREFVSQYSKKT